jgi:hypothetical protein
MMDEVNVILYPVANAKAAFPEAWKGRADLESTKGHSIDHLGFRVTNLEATVARLRKDGVKVIVEPFLGPSGRARLAVIEGPDRIRIEVVEER